MMTSYYVILTKFSASLRGVAVWNPFTVVCTPTLSSCILEMSPGMFAISMSTPITPGLLQDESLFCCRVILSGDLPKAGGLESASSGRILFSRLRPLHALS